MTKTSSPKNKNLFVYDLHRLIKVPPPLTQEEKDLIDWIHDGTSFLIINHLDFEKKILPKYFSMRKFISFTRKVPLQPMQLTKYGFSRSKKS